MFMEKNLAQDIYFAFICLNFTNVLQKIEETVLVLTGLYIDHLENTKTCRGSYLGKEIQ